MADKAFKQIEEELDMIPCEEEPREPRKPVEVDFKDHEDDIKDDYKRVRSGILDNLESAQEVIEQIQIAIQDSDEKFLARKAEVFASLLRVSSDLRKDLFLLHKNKKELLDEFDEEEDEENSSGKITPSNIKDFIIKNSNSFDMKIEDPDEE